MSHVGEWKAGLRQIWETVQAQILTLAEHRNLQAAGVHLPRGDMSRGPRPRAGTPEPGHPEPGAESGARCQTSRSQVREAVGQDAAEALEHSEWNGRGKAEGVKLTTALEFSDFTFAMQGSV